MHPIYSEREESAARFVREAQAAAAVRSDHIVTIFQVGWVEGTPYIAQELLEGETLAKRLRRQPRPTLGESLGIAGDIAKGLPGKVIDPAFAPDGQHLASANGNGTVYICRLPK